MITRRLAWLPLALIVGGAAPARAQDAAAQRAGAWDRSVALEHEGRADEARRLLMAAWGPYSESYEVTVRIAWLSLRLGDAEQAVTAYARARTLPGAGPEATEGLASALTMLGYRELDRGEVSAAKQSFAWALAVSPTQADAKRGHDLLATRRLIEPEIWGAYLYKSGTGPRSQGWSVFAHLPWHVTRALTLRAAYRHVELASARRSSEPWLQHEAYLAGSYEGRWVGGELLGAALVPSDAGVAWMAGARLRIGRSFGAAVEAAALRRDADWNGQLLPTAYWYPVPAFGMAAGARVTRDAIGTSGSAYAGATARVGPVRVDLSGHYGAERWPVTLAVPAVLTTDEELRYGGTLSGSFGVSDEWRLGVQAQVERLQMSTGGSGVYVIASAGVRYSPRFQEQR